MLLPPTLQLLPLLVLVSALGAALPHCWRALLVVALPLQARHQGSPPGPPLASDWLAGLSIRSPPAAEIHMKHRLRMTPHQRWPLTNASHMHNPL